MARIAGVDLPRSKRMEVALTYIYGIGRSASRKILEQAGVSLDLKSDDLSDDDVVKIRQIIDQGYKVEGDLRREMAMSIKRHLDMGSYRGQRHRKNLPVRGQRTHTNARTRKGPRKTDARKKAAPSKGKAIRGEHYGESRRSHRRKTEGRRPAGAKAQRQGRGAQKTRAKEYRRRRGSHPFDFQQHDRHDYGLSRKRDLLVQCGSDGF